jgi:hypothetical protein
MDDVIAGRAGPLPSAILGAVAAGAGALVFEKSRPHALLLAGCGAALGALHATLKKKDDGERHIISRAAPSKTVGPRGCGADPRQTATYARWRSCVETGAQNCGPNPGSNEAYMDWLMCRWQTQDPTLVASTQHSLGVAADGVIGRATRAALAHRQATWGLPATGVMDRATMENFILG